MRIQHNIMAMNAYRNYNTNTSALSKNLEKLSSGYKINRAGDDAAGLAISEKMRAQITGLNAAQKNVKDGISLVKTAEGAMQEIQDMLNRMDYLATQSANGTYDDPVDRYNLEKEVTQLKSEINRIADSSNFNGIKLLNGSLDPEATDVGATEASSGTVATLVTSTKGTGLGTNTILHADGVEAAKTKFSVDLHEVKFSNKVGEKMKITLGEGTSKTEIEITAGTINNKTVGTEVTAADIVAEIAKGNSSQVKINGSAGATANKMEIDGETFSLSASGNKLTFEQDAVTAKHIDGDMKVEVSSDATPEVKDGWKTGVYTAGTTDATSTGMQDDATAAVTVKVPDSTGNGGADETLTFTSAALANAATIDDVITALKATTDTNANGDTVNLTDLYDITKTADGEISLALKDGKTGTVTGFTYTQDSGTTGGTDVKATLTAGAATTAAPAGENPVTGHYNVKTTDTTNGHDKQAGTIASGVVTLTADNFANGTVIKIGNKDYTVTTDKANVDNANPAGKNDYIYVGDLDVTNDLQTAIDRLTVKAVSNEVWTVGQGATTGSVTFVEKVDATGKSYTEQKLNGGSELPEGAFDLTKEDVIKETFGVVTGKSEAKTGTAGAPLTLQIGDTSDTFNRLEVKVGDMHTTAMGKGTYQKGTDSEKEITKSIDDIHIDTLAGAQEAIDVIKNAINYVSSIRGDLGATQNRLEHTANNLSVMAENIQDAESTIRDTDIAEEMMSYTKNNILIQSAQAMLAQANAVPQGVLQLLG